MAEPADTRASLPFSIVRKSAEPKMLGNRNRFFDADFLARI